MEMNDEKVMLVATFNPKVKIYIFFVVLWFLIVSVAGLIIVPFWIFGLGQWLSKKYFATLKCQLSNKNLKFNKGLIIHIEKTIPLDNIQDLSFVGGPILRWFGLTLIKVETAGGGGQSHNSNMMSMIGIMDAEMFKNKILEQREIVKNKSNHSSHQIDNPLQHNLLQEIKNELVSIKNIMSQQAS